jgi:hypothetical protein
MKIFSGRKDLHLLPPGFYKMLPVALDMTTRSSLNVHPEFSQKFRPNSFQAKTKR